MRLPTHSERNENAKRVFEKAATQLRVLSQKDEHVARYDEEKNINSLWVRAHCTGAARRL